MGIEEERREERRPSPLGFNAISERRRVDIHSIPDPRLRSVRRCLGRGLRRLRSLLLLRWRMVMLVRDWMLLLARDGARHVRKLCLSSTRERKQAAELLRLVGSLFVRVRVLLEALDTVLHLWSPETCEEDPRVVARDMHHRWIETKIAVLRQHARLGDKGKRLCSIRLGMDKAVGDVWKPAPSRQCASPHVMLRPTPLS